MKKLIFHSSLDYIHAKLITISLYTTSYYLIKVSRMTFIASMALAMAITRVSKHVTDHPALQNEEEPKTKRVASRVKVLPHSNCSKFLLLEAHTSSLVQHI